MLHIDRIMVKQTFAQYTSNYDITDEKVRLKIEHTYKVADICERIAESEGLGDGDVDLAWLLGMLHDLGRFEQLRRFGTFMDSLSIDHAECGADILFADGKIRDYVDDSDEDSLIETAIRVHNKYRIPESLTAREILFCNILRDADKVDIIRVNVETPLEEIYDVTAENLKNAAVSPAVMQAFREHHTVLRDLMETSIDHLVGHIAFVFELVYGMSCKIVKEQGFLNQMMEFQSENEETRRDFEEIKREMNEFLAS